MPTFKVGHIHSNPPPFLAYVQSACLPTYRGWIYGLTLLALSNYLSHSCLGDLGTHQFYEVVCALYARMSTRSVNGLNASGIQLPHGCGAYWLNRFYFFSKYVQPSLGHSSERIGLVCMRFNECHVNRQSILCRLSPYPCFPRQCQKSTIARRLNPSAGESRSPSSAVPD